VILKIIREANEGFADKKIKDEYPIREGV